MAKYSVNRKNHYHGGNSDIHEVVMMSDKDGNIINSAGGLFDLILVDNDV